MYASVARSEPCCERCHGSGLIYGRSADPRLHCGDVPNHRAVTAAQSRLVVEAPLAVASRRTRLDHDHLARSQLTSGAQETSDAVSNRTLLGSDITCRRLRRRPLTAQVDDERRHIGGCTHIAVPVTWIVRCAGSWASVPCGTMTASSASSGLIQQSSLMVQRFDWTSWRTILISMPPCCGDLVAFGTVRIR